MNETQQERLNHFFVQNFYKILMLEEKRIREEFGSKLTIREMHLIEAVSALQKTGFNTMSRVADQLYITIGALTTAVNVLVNKGYLTREYDPNDRRKVFLRLTDAGEKADSFHTAFHNQLIDYVEATLDENEIETLTLSLQKLSTFFDDLL